VPLADPTDKGIHSGNIIFPFDEETLDVEKPILSGFEYSRPESNKRLPMRDLEKNQAKTISIIRLPGIVCRFRRLVLNAKMARAVFSRRKNPRLAFGRGALSALQRYKSLA
jgi:hypothetical protein